MEYVVFQTGGKQYRVKSGDILEVDKLPVEKDATVTFDDVLLWVDDSTVRVGTPKVLDVKVKAKVLEQKKGEKIRVAKFKSKVRYRRVMGFRAQLTRIQFEKIESPKDEKASKIEKAGLSPKPVKQASKRSRPKKS